MSNNVTAGVAQIWKYGRNAEENSLVKTQC